MLPCCLLCTRYAANKASIREVAVLFHMAESTLFVAMDRFLKFLCAMAPDVIYFQPNKDALAQEFEKASLHFYFSVMFISCSLASCII